MSDVETAAAVVAVRSEAEAPIDRAGPGQALLLVLINVLWAGSAIAAKAALGSGAAPQMHRVGPYVLSFFRFGPAAILLYLLVRASGHQVRVRREHLRDFLALGIFGLALTYGVFYGGMRWTTATESTLLIAAEPILIALIARVLLGERLRRVQSIGLAVGFVGVYTIVNQGVVPRFSPSVVANAVIALALCFESYSSVIGKRLARHYPGLVVLTVEMAVGAAALLPFALHEALFRSQGFPSASALAGMAFLTLICTVFCYGVWFHLLPRLQLSSMAGFLFIQPMMGPVYSYLLLGERLRPWTAAGAALVLLGVWLVAGTRGRPGAAETG